MPWHKRAKVHSPPPQPALYCTRARLPCTPFEPPPQICPEPTLQPCLIPSCITSKHRPPFGHATGEPDKMGDENRSPSTARSKITYGHAQDTLRREGESPAPTPLPPFPFPPFPHIAHSLCPRCNVCARFGADACVRSCHRLWCVSPIKMGPKRAYSACACLPVVVSGA